MSLTSGEKEIEEIKKAIDIQPHTINEAKEALDKSIALLVHTDMFYANFILNMRKIVNHTSVPTAAVNITDQPNLYVNPDFFCSLDSTLLQAKILKHECQHLMNLHITRADEIGIDAKNMKMFNIAADLEINETNRDLKQIGGMFVETFNEGFQQLEDEYKEKMKTDKTLKPKNFPRLEHNDTAESYYVTLKKFQQENPEMAQAMGFDDMDSIDDHEIWQEGTANGQVAKEIVKNAMKKAIEASGGIGSMAGDIALALDKLNKSTVNWKRELRQFFENSLQFDYEGTRKRRNRRTGILNQGKRKKPQLHVAIAVDTSGSMSDKALQQVFSEIAEVHKHGAKITVIEADCEVQDVYDFDPKKKIEIKGRGGTAYQPAFDYANDNLDIDGMIFCGDMDAADTPLKPKYPVLWAVNGGQNPPANFGKTVRIEVDGER